MQSSQAQPLTAASLLHAPSETDSTGTEATDASAVAKGLGPRIYIGGVSTAISQTMIRNHFSQFGKVADVYFPRHHQTGQRQAFCFVTFTTRKAANTAVSKSKRTIHGHQVGSVAHTTDRVTHYRTTRTGQESQGDTDPEATAAQPLAAGPQHSISMAYLLASQAAYAASRQHTAMEQVAHDPAGNMMLPHTLLATTTPTPAEILATAQRSLYTPTGLSASSEYIMDMMAAYKQALASNNGYGIQPVPQNYNPPMHCEEAMLWHHLKNL